MLEGGGWLSGMRFLEGGGEVSGDKKRRMGGEKVGRKKRTRTKKSEVVLCHLLLCWSANDDKKPPHTHGDLSRTQGVQNKNLRTGKITS